MSSSFRATESREQKQGHNQDNTERNLKSCASNDQIIVNDDTFVVIHMHEKNQKIELFGTKFKTRGRIVLCYST